MRRCCGSPPAASPRLRSRSRTTRRLLASPSTTRRSCSTRRRTRPARPRRTRPQSRSAASNWQPMEAERVSRRLGPLSAAALLTTALSGQADWEDRSTSVDARSGHELAFDMLRGRTLLFGGTAGTRLTWEWDGTTWTRRAPANAPPARFFHAMAYDLARGCTVLFGGQSGATQLADTWE